MLDRPPDSPDAGLPSFRAGGFFRAGGAGAIGCAGRGLDPCRLAGEDVPAWLAAGFAVIGAMIAVASAAAWQSAPIMAPQPAASLSAPEVAAPPQARDEMLVPSPALERESRIPWQPPSEPVHAKPPAAPAQAAASPAATIGEPASAAASAAAAGPKAAATECFSSLVISFARNSARPNIKDVHRSAALLRQWLAGHRGAVVVIEGHSDPAGTEDYNVLLSYSRAKAIATLLQHDGIPLRQTTIRAAGSSEATGTIMELASDRNAILRIAGVDDCAADETVPRTP